MSDTFLRIFPADPNFVPDPDRRRQAIELVSRAIVRRDEVTDELSEQVRFIDAGGNWEGVRCPNCGHDLDDWWSGAMDRAWESRFADLFVETPCCAKPVSLNQLEYGWPVGFARYSIEVRNPEHDLSDADLRQIQTALGTELRMVWAHI